MCVGHGTTAQTCLCVVCVCFVALLVRTKRPRPAVVSGASPTCALFLDQGSPFVGHTLCWLYQLVVRLKPQSH